MSFFETEYFCYFVQSLNYIGYFATPWSIPGFPILHLFPELAQIHVRWVSDAIQPFRPLFPPSPSAFNLSQHQVFSNELALHNRWPKYWSFSFSISPSNEYLGLISFRIYWFDLLAVQGALRSLLQHHKRSILDPRSQVFCIAWPLLRFGSQWSS